MAQQVLKLHRAVEAVDGSFINELTFRPATYGEVLEHKAPFERVPLEGGGVYETRDDVAMKDWITRLLVEPKDKSAPLRMTDPRDFAALEAMIRGFFIPPQGEILPEISLVRSGESVASSGSELPESPKKPFIG